MTTKLPPRYYLPLWHAALEQEIGIEIKYTPTDRQRLVNALYEARKESDDDRLQALILLQPKEGVIFIARKAVELPA